MTLKERERERESVCFLDICGVVYKKYYSGAHSRVATLIQPSFQILNRPIL